MSARLGLGLWLLLLLLLIFLLLQLNPLLLLLLFLLLLLLLVLLRACLDIPLRGLGHLAARRRGASRRRNLFDEGGCVGWHTRVSMHGEWCLMEIATFAQSIRVLACVR